MHPLFSISKLDIQALTDEQARELVARLSMAELERKGYSRSAVSWGGNQRSADDGVDVEVDIGGKRKLKGYVPAALTFFQVKAEKFGPQKVTDEMVPEGRVRKIFSDLAVSNGAYIIVSTHDDVSKKYMTPRLDAMKAVIAKVPAAGKITLNFYDSQKLADWVSAHPTVAIWVRSVLGRSLQGWKSYGAWAHGEVDQKAEYLLDDGVRIFGRGRDSALTAIQAINLLRAPTPDNLNVRIVGLSGVGKTRLVQALFDKRLKTTNPALDANMVTYCDFQDDVDPPPNVMLDSLTASMNGGVLVVDNCSSALHARLAAENAKAKKLRLITIEYDIRDDKPEDTNVFRLEGVSDEIIRKILARRHDILTSIDISTIVRFSDGNARVALALASTATRGGELAALGDETLFKRLFEQANQPNDELMRAAEVLSLLYSFNGTDTTPNSELGTLARLAEMTVKGINRHIAELNIRGLLQSRAQWRAVLPLAIANRLAKQALAALPADDLTGELLQGPARVARSFSRRLGYLHDSEVAQQLMRQLTSDNGRLADLYSLGDDGFQIFLNLAPVDPAHSLTCIERACARATDEQLGSDRSLSLATVLRGIAYDASLFERAVAALITLVRFEGDEVRHNSRLEVLRSLFHCFHSGTHATVAQRLVTVSRLVRSEDELDQRIGLSLLQICLADWNTAQNLEPEFGAHKRDHGWWPESFDEMVGWYQPFLDLAVEIMNEDAGAGQEIDLILAEAIRGLWVDRGLWRTVKAAIEKIEQARPWPEGWLALKWVSNHGRRHPRLDGQKALPALIARLAPNDLMGNIRAKILGRGSFSLEDLDDTKTTADIDARYELRQAEAVKLGQLAAGVPATLSSLLPSLLANRTGGNKVLYFGIGVGEAHSAPKSFIEICRAEVGSQQPASFTMLIGFLQGWSKQEPDEIERFLDEALTDEVWAPWFPMLQCAIGLEGMGYARLKQCLDRGIAPIDRFRALAHGRVTDALAIVDVFQIIDEIKMRPNGILVAVDVLHMVIHCSATQPPEYRAEVGAATISFLNSLSWSDVAQKGGTFEAEVQELVGFAVKSAESFDDVSMSFDNLLAFGRSKAALYKEFGQYAGPYFRRFPQESLDLVFQPDTDGRYVTSLRLVGNALGRHVETPIKNIDDDLLLDWCGQSDERRFFVASTCRLYDTDDRDDGDAATKLSSIAVALMKDAAHQAGMLQILVRRIERSSINGPFSATLIREREILDATSTGDDALDGLMRARSDELGAEIATALASEAEEERNLENVSFE
ncbi:hypothetical protein JNB91_18725 [Rhizobium wenxiniae]|uniref:hypothetical protein n=1 Tax=Rhizobium wenxiniae TaxID=1737357 RepID=UPI001C6F4E89|nr:hypothetical protein [Rhizobium wenxiniae]MBW9089852.1 hypothetical protein [Rhizobium wenxiniae]